MMETNEKSFNLSGVLKKVLYKNDETKYDILKDNDSEEYSDESDDDLDDCTENSTENNTENSTESKKNSSGYVYIFHNDLYGNNIYKIGRSINVKNRLKDYKTYNLF